VVDGHFEFVGSDERRALLAIESATKAEKVPVSVSAVHPEAGSKFTVHVETGQLPSSLAAGSAEVLIATADESDESHDEPGRECRKDPEAHCSIAESDPGGNGRWVERILFGCKRETQS
jgi:hypothetical protein